MTTTVDTFRAFRVFDENGKIGGRLVQASLNELSGGEVVIRAAWSSVNYKDALAATGAGKIIRKFPLVGGIDVSGTVASSSATAPESTVSVGAMSRTTRSESGTTT